MSETVHPSGRSGANSDCRQRAQQKHCCAIETVTKERNGKTAICDSLWQYDEFKDWARQNGIPARSPKDAYSRGAQNLMPRRWLVNTSNNRLVGVIDDDDAAVPAGRGCGAERHNRHGRRTGGYKDQRLVGGHQRRRQLHRARCGNHGTDTRPAADYAWHGTSSKTGCPLLPEYWRLPTLL